MLRQTLKFVLGMMVFLGVAFWWGEKVALGMGSALILLLWLNQLRAHKIQNVRLSMVTILQAYHAYFLSLIDLLLLGEKVQKDTSQKRMQVEKVLQSAFPDWVYDERFSATFEEGHRFFLIKIQQMGSVLFALHGVVRDRLNEELLSEFSVPLNAFAGAFSGVCQLFIERLSLKELSQPVTDLSDLVFDLEETYRRVVTIPIELWESYPDCVRLTALIFYCKDLQQITEKMAEALR